MFFKTQEKGRQFGFTVCILVSWFVTACLSGASAEEKIAFASRDSDKKISHICIMNTDGSERVVLTTGYDRNYKGNPAWSPDGRQIAFESSLSTNAKPIDDIWIVSVSMPPRKIVQLNIEKIMGVDWIAWQASPSWSPDGKQIAFSLHRHIFTIDLKRMTWNQVTKTLHSAEYDPCWASDGRKFAISVEALPAIDLNIYVVDANGENRKQLTVDPADDSDPVWSPDGKRIAFQSMRDGNYEIYVMNADGKNLKNLTQHPAEDRNPSWSLDGIRIAFDSDRSGKRQIYTMYADGRNVVQITKDENNNYQPAWHRTHIFSVLNSTFWGEIKRSTTNDK